MLVENETAEANRERNMVALLARVIIKDFSACVTFEEKPE